MKPIVKIQNLSVSYGNLEAVENITLDIIKGEFLCILGPNGGGKTTLLNTILGFTPHYSGDVQIDESASISYVPQISSQDRSFPISVLDMVLTAKLKKGLNPFKRYTKEEKQSALEALKKVGLDGAEKRQIGELSGGEFQRLLLARALCANPSFLLLDEPTASVDPVAKTEIFEILKNLKASGVTVVAVTHDLPQALSVCDRAVFVNRHLLYCGDPNLQKITHLLYGGEAKC